MGEKGTNDREEYKKRVKELIERVEKGKIKDYDTLIGKEVVLEAKERLLQTAKSRVHPDFRNERLIMINTYTIRDYYKRRADSTKKEQFQKEIDELYKLIYEELRKSKKFTLLDDISDINRKGDKLDKKRIINNMTKVLGMENINRDFYKYYKISDIMRPDKYTKEILRCVLLIIFGSLIILFLVFKDSIIPFLR